MSIAGQTLQRLLLPMGAIAVDVIENFRLKDEECAVDPTLFGLRLFGKLDNLVSLHFEVAKAGCRPHRGKRRQSAVPAMKRQQFMKIEIGDSIPPGQHESAVA